jgi:hypothetical protein
MVKNNNVGWLLSFDPIIKLVTKPDFNNPPIDS